jgi:hypothetical protein
MNSTDTKINVLRSFYGKGIHLYTQAIVYQGWLLVPVDWGNENYTISCFCPGGTQYIDWHHYHNLDDVFVSGRKLTEEIIRQLTSFKIRPILDIE